MKKPRPRPYTTTKTPDGGQQYVRGQTNMGKMLTTGLIGDTYVNRTKTPNPTVAENLGRAHAYAMAPNSTSSLAKTYGDIERSMANNKNKNTKARGDKTRR